MSDSIAVGQRELGANTDHPCTDCGRYSTVTLVAVVTIAGKRHVSELCSRCFLRRTVDA